MSKYQVGQKVTLQYEIIGYEGYFYKVGDGRFLSEDFIDENIVPQPAPVADWQPKVGERVLVLGEVRGVYPDGGYLIYDPVLRNSYATTREAIVGPAPVQSKFKVGDEVVRRSTAQIVTIEDIDGETCTVSKFMSELTDVKTSDLLTLAEARERLAK